LESVGFSAAPRHLGLDDRGREVLSFIEGDVAVRPWPSWVADDARAVSVARLLRRLDDALVPLGLPVDPPAAPPGPVVARPGPPPFFLGHRDVTPENTVFRDGSAYAFIDFDLVRPVTRADEVANLLLWWGAWLAPQDREPVMREIDAPRRGRLLADAYGLDDADRELMVPLSVWIADRTWYSMRDRARRYGGGWARMWAEGVGDSIRRREQWLIDNAAALNRALTV
jgi:hypothetical protein